MSTFNREKPYTKGILDLGGASTQIVYVPDGKLNTFKNKSLISKRFLNMLHAINQIQTKSIQNTLVASESMASLTSLTLIHFSAGVSMK